MENKNKFTSLHRILHWIIAGAMLIQFTTGFLRMKWMGKSAVADAISSQGLDVTKDQAKAVYKSLLKPMWQWHELFAKIIILTLIIRIIYMLAKGIRFPNPFKAGTDFKERLQGLTYIYFYVFVCISAVTGICLELKLFSGWEETIESVHKIGLYWFPVFILLHVTGVFIAEFTNKKGITSKMISGD